MGCGTITADGECNVATLQYCDTSVQPNVLVTVDCTVQFGNGASCMVDPGGRAACIAGGGACLMRDSSGMMMQVACAGNTPGCVQTQQASACTDPLPACGPNDVGVCSGDRLIVGCLGTQPWLLDCPSYGATCQGGVCAGAALGEPCNTNVTCAAPYVCGRLSRCAEPADAGVSSPDAMPAPDAGAGVPVAPDAAPAADAAPVAQLDAAPVMPAPDAAAAAHPDAAAAAPFADAAVASNPDAGSGSGSGSGADASDGCTCSSSQGASAPFFALAFLAVIAWRRRSTT